MRRPHLALSASGPALALSLALSLAPGAARAEGTTYLNVGPLASFTRARATGFGLGGELSIMHFPGKESPLETAGYGLFAQAQAQNGAPRLAFGVQGGSYAGLELGASFRGETDAFAPTWGLHLAPFASAGVAVLSLRTTFTVRPRPGTFDKPTHGFEIGPALALKLPLLLRGKRGKLGIPHG